MAKKSFFGGLLALAVIATMSFFASPADAKVRQCMIGGVPHYTAGEDGQVIKATSWAEKGKIITLTWANTAKTAVKVKIDRLPKATSAPAPKKIQVQKKATQHKQPKNNKKASKENIKAAAKAPMTGTAFQPVQPPTFWSWLWHGVEWNMKPVIPTVIKPVPAPVQAVPPTKLKRRATKKRGSPTKPCEQGIRATKFIPVAPKSPVQTVAVVPQRITPPIPKFVPERVVHMAYNQWPQKTPDGDWNDLGHCLERINPHTALSERVEKPIQQTLIWAESASGQVFVGAVFGPMGSCPEGIQELKPIKSEKKEDFS